MTPGPRIRIAQESPLTREARSLIAASDSAMRTAFPPEECFTLAPEQLDTPDIRFFIARRAGEALGCVAMVIHPDYAEVKRLLVLPKARGLGIGQQLMAHLETVAGGLGLAAIRLETGPVLTAAMRLYTSLGYVPCAPFGGYPDIPSNLFMEKRLS